MVGTARFLLLFVIDNSVSVLELLLSGGLAKTWRNRDTVRDGGEQEAARIQLGPLGRLCLLYTSDAADE